MSKVDKPLLKVFVAQLQLESGGSIHETSVISESVELALDRFLNMWNKESVEEFYSINIGTAVDGQTKSVYTWTKGRPKVVGIIPVASMLKSYRVIMWAKGDGRAPMIREVQNENTPFSAATTAARQGGWMGVRDLQYVTAYELDSPGGKPAGQSQSWGTSPSATSTPATRAVLVRPVGTAMVKYEPVSKPSETSFKARTYSIKSS